MGPTDFISMEINSMDFISLNIANYQTIGTQWLGFNLSKKYI